ncbi:Rap1a/Tai family immunity protein [Pseudomonas sp. p21]|uniref:Rap1a/Tai family immunity protein n=1 Tax=Pseudomonas sp. p21 TaxID=1825979 RepID=UPI0007C7187B|nr:Rap1a/Tai family immunity protein [Pseudomonas sp. p21]
MKSIAVVLSAALGLMSNAALGNGNELIGQCQAAVKAIDGSQTNASAFGAGFCMGKVTGVMDMISIFSDRFEKQYQICMPTPGIQYGQGVRIVTKYLQDNPTLLHLEDTFLIHMALRRAFPCK